MISLIRERKLSHLEICLKKHVSFRNISTGFDDIFLIHNSLPEFDLEDIDLQVEFFGHKFNAPIIISAMTGGSELSYKVNRALALAAERLGIGMGVGSQRIALERPELSYTFSIVRESAPNIFVMGNIGAAQFSLKYGLDEAFKAVEMVDADALAVHLNPLQEAVQPEGEPFYDGVLEKLKLLSSSLKLPIIAKETGSGISGEVAAKLEKVGISGVDVGGAGGTSWAAVEYYRSLEAGDLSHASLAELFWDWGIPTAISICEVSFHTNLPIIATGGVRSGIDIAKALALGASLAGIALPLLKPAVENGVKGVLSYLERLINELKVAMFLVGARRIADLKRIPLIIGGFTGNWLKLRGISLEEYARRGGKL